MSTSNRQTSMRTHMCAEIGDDLIGTTVAVCGWVAKRREHGDKLAFVDLRDHTGIVQCVIDNGVDVRSEWVVQITGVVQPRPEGTVNAQLPTGQIELTGCTVKVLNAAEPP
ncbi:MAG: aspartyl-tRNA synthetase, partial [Actinomycetota bacterium]